MRALVIDGPRSAHVAEVEPPVAGTGQVVVDVLRAGICGTDVELFTGQLAYFGQGKTRFPVRPQTPLRTTRAPAAPETGFSPARSRPSDR